MVSDPRGRSTSVGVEGRRSRNRGGPPVFTRTTITTTAASEKKMSFCGGKTTTPADATRRRTSPQSGDSLTVIFLPKYPTMEKEVDYFPTYLASTDALRISRRFPAAYYMPMTDMEVCGDSDVDLLKRDVIPNMMK